MIKNLSSKFKYKYENLVTRTLGIIWVMMIKENGKYISRIVSKIFLKENDFIMNLYTQIYYVTPLF